MKLKHKTFILLTVLLSLVRFDAQAQKTYNNSVKLHTASFSIPKFKLGDIAALVGGSYERRLSRNFSASLGYFQWRRYIRGGFKTEIAEYPYDRHVSRGDIVSRTGYAMVDMSAFYNCNIYKQKHFLKAGTGVSYTWGWNRFVGEQQQYSFFHGWVGPYEIEKVGYWGVVPQLSYDYVFLKNRMNIGADVRGRYYLHVPNHQYDIGIHAGVNF